ncbi:17131_t:CDS:2 [Entrophospora sp. SA101]|nr:17131_t:CDS:2 [Entrophospora sp. SA101]
MPITANIYLMTRYVSIGHRLTGWNAVKNRVEQLDLSLTDEQIKKVTTKIKELADIRPQSMEDVDNLLRSYHHVVTTGDQSKVDIFLSTTATVIN